MATAKKVWKGEANIASTNAYGGPTADLAADEAWDFFGDIDLETAGHEGALIYLRHTSAGTTDDINLGIFPSVDGAGANRASDTRNIIEKSCDATVGGDIQESPVVIEGLQHFEVGLKTTGTTDTFDFHLKWDAWRWDIS